MDIKIEDLKYEDIEEAYKLTSLVFEEAYDLDEIKSLYLKLHEDKNQYRFLVAKKDNVIVGFLSLNMAYNLFDGNKPFMTLWWVCTHPDYRRLGIATKLLNEAEIIGQENNCELICFLSENKRIDAHAFYMKNGYDMGFKGFMKLL